MGTLTHDIGATIKPVHGHAFNLVAGGAADGVLQTGAIIDRLTADGGSLARSCVVAIPISATLAEGETATIATKMEDGAASDLADAADFGTAPADLVLTGGTGGSTETGILLQKLDLAGAKQYIRQSITVTLSAASVDTAVYGVTIVLGPGEVRPTT